MDNCDILIIGAGAAGLMAARTLAKSGKKVIVLEARNRCGGRIHTLYNELFFKNTELGAEFVHGDLPATLSLLNEAGIQTRPSGGEMWHYEDSKFNVDGGIIEEWDLLMDRLKKLETDISINDFLEREFPGEKYEGLKNSVRRFVWGYDSADPGKASAFALRNEWLDEDQESSHRVNGGYGQMIGYLEDECKHAGGVIFLNSIVKEIHWEAGKIKANTADGMVYEAEKVIIALPLGVLQANNNEKAAVTFIPPIPEHTAAFTKIGFGAIIKILLEFDSVFWEDDQTEALAGKSLKNMGFLITDEDIPAWWTQAPEHSPVLTGWLSGPGASKKKDMPDDELLQLSLQTLSNIFKREITELKDKLVSFQIANWTKDPFTLGSYAYDTVATASARKILNEPLADTLFFAGEYLYDGAVMGTVEAALVSGKTVSELISKPD